MVVEDSAAGGAMAVACCSVQLVPSQLRMSVQVSSAGSETETAPEAFTCAAAARMSSSERFDGPSQKSSGSDSAGTSLVSSNTSPGATFAFAGLTTFAVDRAMPSNSWTRRTTPLPAPVSAVEVNSLPGPMPETRPMSSHTRPSSSVFSAAVSTLPLSAAWPPKRGCWRRADEASRSGS